MAAATAEETVTSGKSTRKTTGRLIIAFILMMLVLTLMSNTLLQYSLPRITAKMPTFGGLNFKVNGSGAVESAETVKINSAQSSGPVKEVKVAVGDQVKKGQVLIEFDTKGAEEAIANEQLSYDQQQINLEKLQTSYKEANQSGDEKLLNSIALDIESAKLTLNAQKRKINDLQKQIEQNSKLTSTVNGTVEEVLATVGMTIPPGTAAFTVTEKSIGGFVFKADVSEEQAKYLKVGQSIDITFPGLDDAIVQGKISAIETKKQEESDKSRPPSRQKEIRVALNDKRLQGGEYGDFEWKKETDADVDMMGLLIPNDAIRKSEEDGTFVYYIGEREGSLGKEYFIRKTKVVVKDSDDLNSQIKDGLNGSERIVISSNKQLKEGQRVLFAGGEGEE
ncbi:efflux RND transporter periplasmic adaptor subunit [Paenibacillus terrigena]|uniref:efflux RND transporter periplasmic adaptor subunit n=1 Tax=Paenibacillus terrigena TaxID=369333 RepID=UPI00036B64A8|nr:efflux RND transporter periplasmic adaptor subunit [Paenibacillus terrigena]